jgi:hypothetical protein
VWFSQGLTVSSVSIPRQRLRFGNLGKHPPRPLMRQFVSNGIEYCLYINRLLKRLTRPQQLGRV